MSVRLSVIYVICMMLVCSRLRKMWNKFRLGIPLTRGWQRIGSMRGSEIWAVGLLGAWGLDKERGSEWICVTLFCTFIFSRMLAQHSTRSSHTISRRPVAESRVNIPGVQSIRTGSAAMLLQILHCGRSRAIRPGSRFLTVPASTSIQSYFFAIQSTGLVQYTHSSEDNR